MISYYDKLPDINGPAFRTPNAIYIPKKSKVIKNKRRRKNNGQNNKSYERR